jgi:kynurenine formamidase
LSLVRRIVDLSIPLDRSTPVYPGDPAPEIRPAIRIETDGFNVLSISIGSHAGTHVDAPYHMLEAGGRLEDVDLGRFVGPLVVADATGLEPRSPVTWERIEPVSEQLGPEAILAIRTGWADLHRDRPRTPITRTLTPGPAPACSTGGSARSRSTR